MLTDADVRALARQAVDLLDPAIVLEFEVDPADHGYGEGKPRWTVWALLDGRRSFGCHVYAIDAPQVALARLVDGLVDGVAESDRFWAGAFPACPGHTHPCTVAADAAGVVLSCPQTGATVRRLVPVKSAAA